MVRKLLRNTCCDSYLMNHALWITYSRENKYFYVKIIFKSPYCNRLTEFLHSPLLPVILSSSSTKTINAIRNPKSIPSDAKLINLRPLRWVFTNSVMMTSLPSRHNYNVMMTSWRNGEKKVFCYVTYLLLHNILVINLQNYEPH